MTATPTATIPADYPIPCARCRFDLRGSPIEAACPECGLAVMATRGARVDGRWLVVRSSMVLPARCVKTNAPVAGKPIWRNLFWMHPAWWLAFLLGLPVLVVVYLLVRRRCTLTYYVSRDARRRLMVRQGAAMGVVGLGAAALIHGALAERPWEMIVGGAIILAGIVVALIYSSEIRIARTTAGEFWISGCGPEFLASIDGAARPATR